MSFEKLPLDLKDVISAFAYTTKWSKTASSLQMCETIASYSISPMFLRLTMWSWAYGTFLPNPLYVFEPIGQYTGRWADMIDWNAVSELLYRLDYRRRLVRIAGTRSEWFSKFRNNWLNIRLFDSFYRILVHSGVACWKPTYSTQLQMMPLPNSPYYSARWILEDFETWGDS